MSGDTMMLCLCPIPAGAVGGVCALCGLPVAEVDSGCTAAERQTTDPGAVGPHRHPLRDVTTPFERTREIPRGQHPSRATTTEPAVVIEPLPAVVVEPLPPVAAPIPPLPAAVRAPRRPRTPGPAVGPDLP